MSRISRESPESREERSASALLRFEGVLSGLDVYNPSVMRNSDGSLLLAGRIESRENTLMPEVAFFQEATADTFVLDDSLPRFGLEDPALCRIGGEFVLSGVNADWDEQDPSRLLGFRQVFYRGDSLENLTECMRGPEGMKDIRLGELPGGRVVAFTRPQGGAYGPGKIGVVILDSLDALSVERIESAPILEAQFPSDVWEGANAVYPNISETCECVGVLAHKAHRDEAGDLHYVATTFIYNPLTDKRSAVEELASRSDFPPGEAKRADLHDVVFPGALLTDSDGTTELYAGLSDVNVGRCRVENPFREHVCPE